ncbi:MAG: ABC transporter permease subunit [Spirochaetes bacterium]|nr:ABC transporter permease subunit [Spirochaetota bacterium]
MKRSKAFTTLLFNTFQKEWRNRGFLVLSILTVLFILILNEGVHAITTWVSSKSGTMMVSDFNKLVRGQLYAFYMVISVWSGLLGALIGVNAVRTDYESRVISQILSFPLHKRDYLAARVLGAWLLVVLYYVGALLIALLYFSMRNGTMAFEWAILVRLLFTSLSVLVYVLLGVMLSLLLPKLLGFVLSAMVGFFAFIADWFIGGKPLAELFNQLGFFKAIGLAFYLLFPHVGNMGGIADQLLGIKAEGPMAAVNPAAFTLWFEAGHFLVSTALLAFLTWTVFKKSNQEMG